MRFHVLGVSFAKTNKDTSADGFSQKVRLFCKMMTEMGHTVYHYGIEGSDPICSENINVVSNETFIKEHMSYDFKKDGFNYQSDTISQEEFNRNAIIEINKRKKENDFLCFSFGFPQKPIADYHYDLIHVEIGIGFDGAFTKYRIYESYSWMHSIYGKYDILPNPYDAVIPNFYDLDDYIYSEKKDDYFFFIARQNPLKGLETAVKCVEYVNSKLIVAGSGEPHISSPNMEFVGVVNFEERAKLMSKAKATFTPTIYNEPFGSTVIESLLCGTPVISTDWGAFTETVKHGLNGYRCRTMEQFYWATENINNIKPINCRKYAEDNYSLKRISKMYEDYFESLYRLKIYGEDAVNYPKPNRNNLNWLTKYLPEKINDTIINNKKILSVLVGYDVNIEKNISDNRNIIMKLSEKLSSNFDVYVFGTNIDNKCINNVKYLNSNLYNEFQKNNDIDIIILSRYIFPFADHELKSRKIFLWLHEQNIIPYYNSRELNNSGKGFLKNIKHKIDKIISTNEYYNNFVINYYNLNDNDITIIENGINIDDSNIKYNKIKNKFISTIYEEYDIDKYIDYFKYIKMSIKDAEFFIFSDFNLSNYVNEYDYIYSFTINDYNKYLNHLKTSEYYINLSNYNTINHIHIKESKSYQTLCILKQDLYFNNIYNNEELSLIIKDVKNIDKTVNKIIRFTQDINTKNIMNEKSYEWALSQSWDNKINEWNDLFKK